MPAASVDVPPELIHKMRCSRCIALQERTVLKLPERLAAYFLLWQAGRDLPLSENPFSPALVEVQGSAELCTCA